MATSPKPPSKVSKTAAPAKPRPKPAKPRAKAKPKATAAGPGRPSTITPEIIEALCTLIAEGSSGREACEALGISRSAMHKRLADDKEFQDQYTRAREMQADLLFGQIIEIADTPMVGKKEVGKEWGTEVTKADMIEHRRLQVESRKWVVSRLAPKKYGDKLQLAGAEDLAPIQHNSAVTIDPSEAYRRMISGGAT